MVEGSIPFGAIKRPYTAGWTKFNSYVVLELVFRAIFLAELIAYITYLFPEINEL
jgi:hypothetical protein